MLIGIDARILQDSQWRGQSFYIYYLVNNILNIDNNDRVILFYNGCKQGKFAFAQDKENLKQVWCRIPGRLLRYSWARFDFPRVEDLIGKVDVYHSAFNFNYTHYTPVPSRAVMVSTFNGMSDAILHWGKDKRYDLSLIDAWLKAIAKRSARVIAISNSAKDDLIRRTGISAERVKVIYYGVNDKFKVIEDKTQTGFAINKYGLAGKRYILYVGGAEENKNLSGLLTAFSRVHKNSGFDDVFLALAGKIDAFYEIIRVQAQSLGISSKVIFTGYIGHDDLPMIYNGAEAFVIASFVEAFGLSVIEAMACGVPVLASNNAGIAEVSGGAALLFDPRDTDKISDALTAIMTDAGLREQLKQKGLTRAGFFSWKKCAKETLDVYREAMDR